MAQLRYTPLVEDDNDSNGKVKPPSGKPLSGLATTLIVALAIGAIALGITSFGFRFIDAPNNIRRLNTVVGPANNNVNLVVRSDLNGGLAIEDNTLASGLAGESSIAFRNLGVLTATAASGLANVGTGQNPVFNNTGVVAVLADTGISISGPQSGRLIRNEGVLSVEAGMGMALAGTAQNPVLDNAGILNIVVGAGLSSTGTQNPTLENTGLLSAAAGVDIELFGGAQTPTIHHLLSKQARELLESDVSNPVVQYSAEQLAVASNTWVRLPLVAFVGNAGQGDTGGSGWAVPATGLYHVHVSCDVSVTAAGFNGRTGLNIALTLNASSDDPATGLRLMGGKLRSDVSYTNGYINYISLAPTEAPTSAPTEAPTEAPTAAPSEAPTEAPTAAPTEAPTEAPSAAPTMRRRGFPVILSPGALSDHTMSLAASFQVCTGCAGAAIGHALSLHALLDTNGVSADVQQADFACILQTSRVL